MIKTSIRGSVNDGNNEGNIIGMNVTRSLRLDLSPESNEDSVANLLNLLVMQPRSEKS